MELLGGIKFWSSERVSSVLNITPNRHQRLKNTNPIQVKMYFFWSCWLVISKHYRSFPVFFVILPEFTNLNYRTCRNQCDIYLKAPILLSQYWKILYTLFEEKNKHQSYPAVRPMRYNHDWPGKTCPLAQ